MNEFELEKKYVMPTFARKPVELVRGKGMYVYDVEGNEYLDFLAGIGTVSLGHCHPAVVQALSEQAAHLIHVGNYYYIENRGHVANMLSDLLSSGSKEDSWKTFFANSGAEANECAIKMARLWSKKNGRNADIVVTLERSFHGRTLATLSATAQPSKQDSFKPLPAGFIHTPINDVSALERIFAESGKSICAVMVECVQGESGVHPCTSEFLKAAQDLAHAHGALLICDEIQSGMFRCGTYPFAFQHVSLRPDIVTIAKGVASGFPIGMCSAHGAVADTFEPGDHGSTFGGSCLGIACTKATLETFAAEHIGENSAKVGAYLAAQLEALPRVTEVRGLGLMRACDIDVPKGAPALVDKGLEQGLLFNATGPSTLRFLPPLIAAEADVDALMEKLRDLIDS